MCFFLFTTNILNIQWFQNVQYNILSGTYPSQLYAPSYSIIIQYVLDVQVFASADIISLLI